MSDVLKLDNFYKAQFVLSKVLRSTELIRTTRINPDCDVYIKPECLQNTGSVSYTHLTLPTILLV